jgi:flagellar hook-associated protein 2
MLSAINQYTSLYGLYGSSQTNPLSSLYGLGSQVGFGASSSSLYSLGKQEESYKVKLSGYGQLKSAFEDFQKSLDKLNSSQEVAPYKAASSQESVLTASASKDVKAAGTYNVNVSQLATAQTLKSTTVADRDSTIVGTGSLKIQVGTYNPNLNTFTAGAAKEVTVNINPGDGTLSGIANAINRADAGVKASVVAADGGGYQLQLTAKNTGTDNSVKISAADAYGNQQTGTTGLGKLAYDPTAASGSGKNLTETQAAQNAQLTVDGRAVTSQSNAVSTAIQGVTLNVAATGASSVKVDVNRDVTAFETSAKSFVDAYNTLQKSIANLSKSSPTNASPPLANDALSSKLVSQVKDTVAQASTGYGTKKLTLADVGISRQSDGTLSLDKTKLQSAFSANPEGATTLLANTAQKVADVVTRSTGATSELKYTTQNIEQSIQGLGSRKAILQNYTATTAFGLPTDYSLFSYMFSSGSSSGIAQYSRIARL